MVSASNPAISDPDHMRPSVLRLSRKNLTLALRLGGIQFPITKVNPGSVRDEILTSPETRGVDPPHRLNTPSVSHWHASVPAHGCSFAHSGFKHNSGGRRIPLVHVFPPKFQKSDTERRNVCKCG